MTREGIIERIVRRAGRRYLRTGRTFSPRALRWLVRAAGRADREHKRLGLPPYNSLDQSAMWGLDRSVMQPEDFTPAMRAAMQE